MLFLIWALKAVALYQAIRRRASAPKEKHRFANEPVQILDRLHWNPLSLFSEMKQGLGLSSKAQGDALTSGIDTWGVDFALLGPETLCSTIHATTATHAQMACLRRLRVPREEIFAQTGIQFMKFNTLIKCWQCTHRRC